MPPLPPMTQALLLANVALFALDFLLKGLLTDWFALWPLGTHFMPWQVVSYAFLHGGTGHLFFNMLGLWMFGADLERLWGGKRFLQFYMACVLTAAATQLLMTSLLGSGAPTIGASGAIYGLILAYALSFPRRMFDLVGFLPMVLLLLPFETLNILGIVLYVLMLTNRDAIPIPPVPIPAMAMAAIFGGLALLFGVTATQSGVAHFAHLGGMLGAWLMIRFWRGLPPFGRRR